MTTEIIDELSNASPNTSLSTGEKKNVSGSKKEKKNKKMTNSQEKHRKKNNQKNNPPTDRELDERIETGFEELADSAMEDVASETEAVAKTAEDLAKKVGNKAAKISQEDFDALRNELQEANDRGLRALAELENYRSRTNRIMAEDRKYASVDLARAILPIWDNMSRALEAAEKDANLEALTDGLRMMHKQFLDVLNAHHIEKIDAVGQSFDPHVHESIAQLPNADVAPNTIIAETQPGFRLYDRIIRPAQVVLAAPVPGTSPKNES